MSPTNSPARAEVTRLVLAAIVAALASAFVSLSNRDVYSRPEVDNRIEALTSREDLRHKYLDEEVRAVREDVRWIVRRLGGTPSAGAESDHHTP
jgi:hypothetical protein